MVDQCADATMAVQDGAHLLLCGLWVGERCSFRAARVWACLGLLKSFSLFEPPEKENYYVQRDAARSSHRCLQQATSTYGAGTLEEKYTWHFRIFLAW